MTDSVPHPKASAEVVPSFQNPSRFERPKAEEIYIQPSSTFSSLCLSFDGAFASIPASPSERGGFLLFTIFCLNFAGFRAPSDSPFLKSASLVSSARNQKKEHKRNPEKEHETVVRVPLLMLLLAPRGARLFFFDRGTTGKRVECDDSSADQ